MLQEKRLEVKPRLRAYISEIRLERTGKAGKKDLASPGILHEKTAERLSLDVPTFSIKADVHLFQGYQAALENGLD